MFRTAVLACKPCAQETAEGGLCDGSQPGKHSNTLSERKKKEGRSGGRHRRSPFPFFQEPTDLYTQGQCPKFVRPKTLLLYVAI